MFAGSEEQQRLSGEIAAQRTAMLQLFSASSEKDKETPSPGISVSCTGALSQIKELKLGGAC